jgi:MFS family permease
MTKFDSRERRILINTCFGHFMSHFNMLVFPAIVLPLAARVNLDMATVLGFSFWMYLLFGITALPWGLVADRWGAAALMVLFYAGAALAGLAAAVWIDSPVGLTLALAVLGLFSGIYHPAGLGLISKEMTRISLGMGYNGMFGNLGLASAPLLTGLVNWLWGVRAAYLVVCGLNICGLVLIFVFSLPLSRHETTAGAEEKNGLLGAFMILLVAMMLGGIAYRGATVILPAYFELKNHLIFQWLTAVSGGTLSKNLVATSVAAFIYLVGMLGQYTGGRVADRYRPAICYIVFVAVTIPAAIGMGLASDLPLVALAVVYFFFLLGIQPIENTLVARYTPKRLRHSAFGTKFVLTFGVGSLAVKMVATIEAAAGVETVFTALGAIALLLVITLVLLIRWTSRSHV